MPRDRRPPEGPTETEKPASRAEAKRKALLESLERGLTLVRLDARRPGVQVPDKFSNDFGLALNLSWRFAHTDMVVNERGLAATLRFGGVPFRCLVPWSAIWGIVPAGQEGTKAWPADLPPELDGPEEQVNEAPPEPVEPTRPKLKVIRAAAELTEEPPRPLPSQEQPTPPPPADPGDGKPRAPWLRIVR